MPDPAPASPPVLESALIILAAGASSRMGRPKQLIRLGHFSLVEHTVQAGLTAGVWPIVVVLGAEAEKIRPILTPYPVLMVENAAWSEGMASSLRTGVQAVESFSRSLRGAVISVCDQPGLTASCIQTLATAVVRQPGVRLAASRYGGRLGVPAYFDRSVFPRLLSLSGDEGARKLLNHANSDELIAFDFPQLALDLDTPADLEHFRQQAQ